jgi:hypothetical protein
MTDPFAADAEALTALDLAPIAGLLSASATTVAAEIAGLGDAAGWRPAPEPEPHPPAPGRDPGACLG